MNQSLAGTLHHSSDLVAAGHEPIMSGSPSIWSTGSTGNRVEIWALPSPCALLVTAQLFYSEVLSAVKFYIFLFSMTFCTADISIAISLFFSPSLEKRFGFPTVGFTLALEHISRAAQQWRLSYGQPPNQSRKEREAAQHTCPRPLTYICAFVALFVLFFQNQLCHKRKKSTINMY